MCLLSSCYKRSVDSKKIHLWSFDLVSDENDDDSFFFHLRVKNDNSVPLINPSLRFVAKDTTDKLFNTSFYSTETLPDIVANSTYDDYIFPNDFVVNEEVKKIKIRFEWTNSENKKSVRRYVEHY